MGHGPINYKREFFRQRHIIKEKDEEIKQLNENILEFNNSIEKFVEDIEKILDKFRHGEGRPGEGYGLPSKFNEVKVKIDKNIIEKDYDKIRQRENE